VHSALCRLGRARLGFDVEFHVVAVDLGDAHVRDVWTLGTREAAVELTAHLGFDSRRAMHVVGLNPVCRETTSTTDFAAPSGLTVVPQPVSCSAATPISMPTPHFRSSFGINGDLVSSGPKYAAVLLFSEGKPFEFDGKPEELDAYRGTRLSTKSGPTRSIPS
jgi:hypothetical protein